MKVCVKFEADIDFLNAKNVYDFIILFIDAIQFRNMFENVCWKITTRMMNKYHLIICRTPSIHRSIDRYNVSIFLVEYGNIL